MWIVLLLFWLGIFIMDWQEGLFILFLALVGLGAWFLARHLLDLRGYNRKKQQQWVEELRSRPQSENNPADTAIDTKMQETIQAARAEYYSHKGRLDYIPRSLDGQWEQGGGYADAADDSGDCSSFAGLSGYSYSDSTASIAEKSSDSTLSAKSNQSSGQDDWDFFSVELPIYMQAAADAAIDGKNN